MTIGDVLAAIAVIFGIGATWTATVLLTALAFPAAVRRAQETLTLSTASCFGRGLAVAAAGGLASVKLSQSPPGKLFAVLILVCLVALAALGSAGIVRLLGERIQAAGTHLSPFAALTRGAGLYAAAGFLPVAGWFLIAPLALLLSLGSGIATFRHAPTHKPSRPIPVEGAEVPA